MGGVWLTLFLRPHGLQSLCFKHLLSAFAKLTLAGLKVVRFGIQAPKGSYHRKGTCNSCMTPSPEPMGFSRISASFLRTNKRNTQKAGWFKPEVLQISTICTPIFHQQQELYGIVLPFPRHDLVLRQCHSVASSSRTRCLHYPNNRLSMAWKQNAKC